MSEPSNVAIALDTFDITITEVEHALKAVRAICNSVNHCSYCPFRTYDGDCVFRCKGDPSEWAFASEPDNGIPRVFK